VHSHIPGVINAELLDLTIVPPEPTFANGKDRPRPWKNAFAEDGGPTSIVRLWQGQHAYPGTQARIACSSGPTPMIAITRFML
jgi:hypothetical protein